MSYRKLHLGEGAGARYDQWHARRVDALIWDAFVKPLVRSELERAKLEGSGRYLDFACGTGRLLKVGFGVFGAATGIDVSEGMLSAARERVPGGVFHCVDVTRSDAEGLGPFECATMFRFILNAEPDLRRDALAWMARVMPAGATLIVNNHRNATSIAGLLSRLAFWLPQSHRHVLTRLQTVALLEDAGFVVESWHGFRIMPSLFGRPILGATLQMASERLCRALGLGAFGGELVFVARRAMPK